ncbi:MAG: class I SAM-dependent methyltransferase [Elusimicrobiota bacterium]
MTTLCPACREEMTPYPVEVHRDRIQGKEYRLYLCSVCGTGFSEPKESVGSDWYGRAHMGEAEVQKADWRYAAFLEAGLPPGTLLDVGCGAGTFLLQARERGWKVSGLDFNAEHIRSAKAAGLEDVVAQDYRDYFKARAASYDAATLFDVLEHVPEPADMLERLRGVLKPGGRLALTLPDGERPLPWAGLREEWDYPPYHYTRWTEASLRSVLARAGFEAEAACHSPIHAGFFSGLLYYRLLNALFPILKSVLLGAPPSDNRTWTDILAADGNANQGGFRAALASGQKRQALTNAGLRAMNIAAWPLEAPLALAFNLLAPRRGRTLFILARRP